MPTSLWDVEAFLLGLVKINIFGQISFSFNFLFNLKIRRQIETTNGSFNSINHEKV